MAIHFEPVMNYNLQTVGRLPTKLDCHWRMWQVPSCHILFEQLRSCNSRSTGLGVILLQLFNFVFGQIKSFHRYIFSDMLRVDRVPLYFKPEVAENQLLIVALNKGEIALPCC